MSEPKILTVDQSTSGSKALLVNADGSILASQAMEHEQIYPKPGWVEHDPVAILSNVNQLVSELPKKAGVSNEEIVALALTNQRETVLVWDKVSGQPIHNAIVWQDRRTSDLCKQWKSEGVEEAVKEKTGLTLDPYFSATKVKWILDHVEGARSKAEAGDLLLGTIDSWLIWNWTEGKVHATDYTNASRTLLFNIHTLKWDKELLERFDIPQSMLPEVKGSDEIFGMAVFGEEKYTICGVIGDSQGALFGQKCWQPGMVKATYGTGSSLLMHTGNEKADSDSGLVTTIAWGEGGQVEYALEGIIHSSGDTVKWVREQLQAFDDHAEAEAMAVSLTDNEGVYLVPAFVGLGAPYWDPYARAAIMGMSRDSGRKHIVRAAFESIAYQVRDVATMMAEHAGVSLNVLRADGGATRNVFLMQFQAEMLRTRVISSHTAELSAMGAAYLGGLGMKVWPNKQAILELEAGSTVYEPKLEEAQTEAWYKGWQAAVAKVLK